MDKLYFVWGALLLLFVVVFVVKNVREGRAVKPQESVIDPMFRRPRPGTGNRPFSNGRRAVL